MAAEKLARFTLQPGGVDYGKEGKTPEEGGPEAYLYFFWSVARPPAPGNHLGRPSVHRPTDTLIFCWQCGQEKFLQ